MKRLRRRLVDVAWCCALMALHAVAACAEPALGDVDRILARFDTEGPGCAVGIMENGALIHTRGHGYADLEKRIPITADTAFDMASLSKQFTAMSILLLEQQRALSLRDSVRKYVPELGAYADAITLDHLIHHTGGLGDYVELLPLLGVAHTDPADGFMTLAALARLEAPNGPPGTYYEYSNTGYFLLGLVIERVTGHPLDDFVQRYIFGPLGMTQSGFVGRPASGAAMAHGYRADGKGGFEESRSPWLQRGAGQLITTVRDFAKWDENFYTGKVGGAALIARMKTPGLLADGRSIPYGAGLRLLGLRGLYEVNHSGLWMSFLSDYRQLPERHWSVVVMCNRADAKPWRDTLDVAALYLADRPETGLAYDGELLLDIHGGSAPQSMPLGLYREIWTGQYLELLRDDAGFVVKDGAMTSRISAAQGEIYKITQPVYNDDIDTYLVLRPAAGRNAARIFSMSFGAPGTFAHVPRWRPRNLLPYVGIYWSPALGLIYRVRFENGALLAQRDGGEPFALSPMARDEFRTSTFSLRFPPEGHPMECATLDTPGARNIRLVRQPERLPR